MNGSEIAPLTVYYGPMFSGKTSAFIDTMEESGYIGEAYQAFKPFIDDRGEGNYVIRSKKQVDPKHSIFIEIPATPVHEPEEILKFLINGVNIVGIDEAQFLGPAIFPVIRELTYNRHIPVLIAGLPTNFRDEPFGPMPGLIIKADETRQFFAVCRYVDPKTGRKCADRKASKTQRLINGEPAPWDSPEILVGKEEFYEPRCRCHHIVPGRPY